MKTPRTLLLLSAAMLGVLTAVILWLSSGHREPASAPPESAIASTTDPAPPSLAGEEPMEPSPTPEETGFVTPRPQPREPDLSKLAAFDGWIAKWRDAAPEERQQMMDEGARLAAERREEFKALIITNPRQALLSAVDPLVRQELPEEIVALLEKRVSATGDYNVYMSNGKYGAPPVARFFEANGVSYQAYVYGGMADVPTRPQIPLYGVAVDRPLAVAESPVYRYKVGEKIAKGTVVESTCPVSGKETEVVAQTTPVTEEMPTVEVGGKVIGLCESAHVEVLDDQYQMLIMGAGPGGGTSMVEGLPGSSARTTGNFRAIYIRTTFPDQLAAPCTEDQAADDMRDAARYLQETSFGKLTLTSTVTPVIVLPQTRAWYDQKDGDAVDGVDVLSVTQQQARAAVLNLGYDYTQYDIVIVRINGATQGSSWGSLGGSNVWLDENGMGVACHEIGHTLGLGHANSWNTTDGTAYGDGSVQEYGNPFDEMGASYGFNRHYNSISKRVLGWLPSSHVHLPTANGVYRIHAYDQPRLETGKQYGLSVKKDSVRSYNIEYHPLMGGLLADSALVLYSGAIRDPDGKNSNAGYLLDTTPGTTGGKNDGGIQVGRTYSDNEADMHFTVLATNATDPPSLDIAFNRGPFPGNVAPVTTLAASATNISAGGSVTFTATANDANGDALAYHWQFDDGVTGTSNAVYTRVFPNVAQMTAMLTVSDRKGGTARRSVVINVGAHGKQVVAGTITVDGTPIPGVRVSNGTKECYTNFDGTYSLAGLSTGTHTLSAKLAGYTFTPSIANPYTVVAGTNTVNWTATALTAVTLTKIADATEGGADGTFRLTRSGDTTAALTVLVAPPGGTATLTTDYTLSPNVTAAGSFRSFTIPAGAASLDITVDALNDTAVEGPEAITMQVVSGDGQFSASGYVSTAANAAEMTLVDTDTALPQVGVTASDAHSTEGAGGDTGRFTFTRTGSTAAALNLTVAWSGTATNGTDHTTLPATVTIPSGQSFMEVTVSPVNDSLIEGPEDVIATIGTNATYVLGSTITAKVLVADDDTPTVTLVTLDSSSAEAGPDSGMFLFTRTGSTAAPLLVYYSISGSAYLGADYVPLSGQVLIPAGASSAQVALTPYDDDEGERAETVTLAVSSFPDGYKIGPDSTGTVTIADNNDVPVVSVRAGTVAGIEGGAGPAVVFHSTGTGSGTITLNYTVSGTATAGVDYTALTGSINVPVNGSNETVLSIPLISDTLAEPSETVKITLTPGTGYRIVNDPSAEAIIRDNDSGERVLVSAYNSAPTEAGAAGKFYISRAGTAGNLTVSYTLSGTATDGSDYTGLTGSAVIPDTERGVVVAFTPVNDTLAEGTETVVLTVVAAAGYGVDRPGSASLSIADNDAFPVNVGFEDHTLVTSEQPGALGEYRDIAVVLSAASASTVTVTCTGGSGSTALGDGCDWAFVDAANGNAVIPYATITFAPGQTTRNVRIRINPDPFDEAEELAVLELRSPVNTVIDTPNRRHSITIFDDAVPASLVTEERWTGVTVFDSNTWDTVAPTFTGTLGSFTPPQHVADSYSRRLTGLITAPATGTYTFWISGDDVARLFLSTDSTAANKALIAQTTSPTAFQEWDADPSQKSANVNLVAGQSYYLEVQHKEATGDDHVSAAWQGPGFNRIPVRFDDAAPRTVGLLTSSSLRSEADGSEPLLMAVLDRPAGTTPVTVNYNVSGGTATNGSDYTLTPGALTFAGGEQFKLIPLSILTDAIVEIPESIVVSLSSPSGASLGAPASHTITLTDTTDLRAWWKLDETEGTVAADASGTGSTGTLLNGPVWETGFTDNALALNGTSQSVEVQPLNLNSNTVTISAWVKRDGDQPDYTGIAFMRDGAASGLTFGTDNELRYRWNNVVATYQFNSGLTVPDNTWTLCTVVVEPTKATFYMQPAGGTLQTAVNTATHASVPFATKLYLGQDSYGGRFLNGSLDDVRIYKRALNAAAVGVLYQEGLPPAAPLFTSDPISGAGATEDAAYSAMLAGSVTDVNFGELAYSKVSGPAWLSVASSGALSGSPGNGEVGANAFTVRVTDPTGLTDYATLNITVNNVNDTPAWTNAIITKPAASEGVAYSGSLAGDAGDDDLIHGDTIEFTKTSGPAWLAVATDGTLSGTPTSGDLSGLPFTVQVTDVADSFATATLNISVNVTNNDGAWTNANGGSWTVPTNWNGSIIAKGADKSANFANLNLTSNATVTLDGARTIGNLSFGDTTTSHDWILNTGSGGPLTLDVTGGSPLVTVNNRSTTIGAVIAGNDGLTKAGAGTLNLGGANTYSGGTTVSGGTLTLSHLGTAGSGNIALGNGTTLQVASSLNGTLTNTNTLSVTSGNTATLEMTNSSSNASFGTGAITIGGKLIIQRSAGGTATNTFSGDLLGAGTLELGSPSAVGSITPFRRTNFSSATAFDNFTGSVAIQSGANLIFVTGGTLTNSNNVSVNSGGYLTLVAGNTPAIGDLTGDGTIVKNSTGSTATMNVTSGNFTGVIGSSVFSVTGPTLIALNKTGTGTLTLGGANAYTGATTVSGGTLSVTGSLAATTLIVESGGTLGGTGTLGGAVTVQSGGTLAPGVNGTGTLALSSKALTLSGTTAMQIGRTGSTLSTDKVSGITTVTYGGTLLVTNVGGNALQVGDSFQLFSATTRTGSFATMTLQPPGAGLVWNTSTLATTGTISVAVAGALVNPYLAWASAHGLDGSHDDPDHDGTGNLLEFYLGGNPMTADGSILPLTTVNATHVVLTFKRRDDAEAHAGTEMVQWGSDLTGWTDVVVGESSAAPDANGVEIQVIENEAAPDDITVSIPRALASGGKLFARLNITE
ncbi:autotransporter-associated beta strand repeat-containing protein [Luteolibacter arcticus]|uniref:Autotransporter-associated beta strand repeat-containing protein n=1 Tax=Luteolibacter arcticus TaxID=1581411 RepID=A0ABT3GK42_9BACT|nr:Calx-beta domain-containing protein [Luteolibacter arcticus]MCW1923866.1 autotransporter-associated beta strand repeat-containing protein [Luteolibacter arcticus]